MLLSRAKQYIKVNDEIYRKLIQFNTNYLGIISRSPEEYISGYRSKTRIFLAVLIQIALGITGIKFLALGLIREVNFFLISY